MNDNFAHWLLSTTGLSQKELAERLGVSKALVSLLIKGERQPTMALLKKTAAVFSLPFPLVLQQAGIIETPPLDVREPDAKHRDSEDYREALLRCLGNRLPAPVIEKICAVIELEIEFHKKLSDSG